MKIVGKRLSLAGLTDTRSRSMSLLMLSASALAAPMESAVTYTRAQEDMEIKSLPDAPKVPFRQFGGYIPVGGHGRIFFWFVESQSAPKTDPVLMWTNGGPGCSGLTGFFTEHGPLYPQADGTLALNEYAWNKAASMFYVEQPVGVGYSVADSEMQYGDAQAAQDNLDLVAGFFKLFPQFAKNPFFITSESYGGHYMPTLADALVTNGSIHNFGGFMVGNPLTYLTYRNYGEYGTAYGHQLLPKPLWDQYLAAGCDKAPGLDPGAACQKIEDQMEGLIAGLDPYGLDFPKCNDTALAKGRHERWTLRKHLQRARRGARRLGDSPYPYFPTNYQPCTSDWATTYLSRKDVQAAVHATPGGPTWGGNWSACSDAVGERYSSADTAAPMMPYYEKLAGKIRMLVYSGDDDAVCATLGSQQFIWDLNMTVKKEWSPWYMDSGPGCPKGPACKQVAGYETLFDGLSFVTVHGAGHLVPTTRPAAALRLLENFLAGVW